ncbi:MAG: Tetracycline resistance protein tetA(P) [Microgenomates group bacterium GW2011_GWF2_45_18]|nr:MAG: Tetracycline resistance protein tetA(P) [Microgenomates group bacterium GW2011_GWF1_44_10]KKU01529.1 MAG: Tetracycline resistance protein tetA(P) [Microgenomates group bacterium GW2011_GWF2_45_18]HAU99437.1 hypothetical protein [Candidatus Paceibacterota bacterium]HAX01557.1 hypothetical protein [Candidatus Paceibacterota bacterium]
MIHVHVEVEKNIRSVMARNIKYFFIAQSFSAMYFWMVLAVPFLTSRGYSPTQVFSFLAFYNFIGLILEYPTGVLGDRIGHQKTLYICFVFAFLFMISVLFASNTWLVLLSLILGAIASGLESGNDMGLLKSISTSIRIDTANYNALRDMTFFVGSILAGFLASLIGYAPTLLISGFCMLLGVVPLSQVKVLRKIDEKDPKISEIVQASFRALSSKPLLGLFIVTMVVVGYAYSVKSVFGSFTSVFQIPVEQIGILIGLGGLLRAMGAKGYASISQRYVYIFLISIVASFFIIGLFPTFLVMVLLISLTQLFFGYVMAHFDGELHELTEGRIRSSMFSLKRICVRTFSILFLAVYGFSIDHQYVGILYLVTAGLLAISILFQYRLSKQK